MQQKDIWQEQFFLEAIWDGRVGDNRLFVIAGYLIDCAATQLNWIQGGPKEKSRPSRYFSLIDMEYQRKGGGGAPEHVDTYKSLRT